MAVQFPQVVVQRDRPDVQLTRPPLRIGCDRLAVSGHATVLPRRLERRPARRPGRGADRGERVRPPLRRRRRQRVRTSPIRDPLPGLLLRLGRGADERSHPGKRLGVERRRGHLQPLQVAARLGDPRGQLGNRRLQLRQARPVARCRRRDACQSVGDIGAVGDEPLAVQGIVDLTVARRPLLDDPPHAVRLGLRLGDHTVRSPKRRLRPVESVRAHAWRRRLEARQQPSRRLHRGCTERLHLDAAVGRSLVRFVQSGGVVGSALGGRQLLRQLPPGRDQLVHRSIGDGGGRFDADLRLTLPIRLPLRFRRRDLRLGVTGIPISIRPIALTCRELGHRRRMRRLDLRTRRLELRCAALQRSAVPGRFLVHPGVADLGNCSVHGCLGRLDVALGVHKEVGGGVERFARLHEPLRCVLEVSGQGIGNVRRPAPDELLELHLRLAVPGRVRTRRHRFAAKPVGADPHLVAGAFRPLAIPQSTMRFDDEAAGGVVAIRRRGRRRRHDQPLQQDRTPTGLSRSTRASCDRGGRPLNPGDSGAHTTGPSSPAATCRITRQRP